MKARSENCFFETGSGDRSSRVRSSWKPDSNCFACSSCCDTPAVPLPGAAPCGASPGVRRQPEYIMQRRKKSGGKSGFRQLRDLRDAMDRIDYRFRPERVTAKTAKVTGGA